MGRLQDKRHEKQRGGGGAAASGVFLSFMEMVLGSRVPPPSLLGSEVDGGSGDAVSQSCLRGPWKTRRERHWDAIAQEMMD